MVSGIYSHFKDSWREEGSSYQQHIISPRASPLASKGFRGPSENEGSHILNIFYENENKWLNFFNHEMTIVRNGNCSIIKFISD